MGIFSISNFRVRRNAFIALATLPIWLSACTPSAQQKTRACEWAPVASDNFKTSGSPNSHFWIHETGGDGWGNHELQNYTASVENSRVVDQKLVIEARHDRSGYSSARLRSAQAWTYGRFDIRSKLPHGRGLWPAIWLIAEKKNYGDSYWPDNGELDIMENVGFSPNLVFGTAHSKKHNVFNHSERGKAVFVPDAENEFHKYSIIWLPKKIEYLVDDSVYFRINRNGEDWQTWPYDKPFVLVVNLAVGGDLGGQKGVDESIFPARFELESVTVSAAKNLACGQ